MITARLGLAAFCASLVLLGCGTGVPPVGNYATITGVVSDAATGQPIAGAVVTVSVEQSNVTGADGRYKLYPVPTGPYTSISATAPNYQPYTNNAGGTLTPGQTLEVNITMTHQ
jgi:uncharacterized membrane protein